jgi:hypothetical protein
MFSGMRRFSSFAIAAAVSGSIGSFGLVGRAHAQSQAEIAAKLNDEGKELMYADKYAEAAKKFAEAVARVPEAKYFVNLCTARLQEGKLDEALTACNAVELNNPTPDQKARADKLIVKINDEAKKQNLELHPGGGGGGDPGPGRPPDPTRPADPNRPPPPPTYTPTVGRPLGQNLVMAQAPDNRYTWTLGIDLFGGGGQVGQPDWYGSATRGLRIKVDYLLNPASRVGGQGYVQVNRLDRGRDQMATSVESLDIIDTGVAGYKHLCLGRTPRLCITPLLGVHISLMSPAGETDSFGDQVFNYAAVGARGEVALSYAFGTRYEHVLSAMAGVNVYSPVFSESGFVPASDIGLDAGGALGYFGFGYTYRFNTPLGSSPFIILE